MTSTEQALIKNHLEELLSSRLFNDLSHERQLLVFVINETLAGRSEGLSETGIAAGYYPDRKITEGAVRTAASRLRKKLAEYYLESPERSHYVRFKIPLGGYRPEFIWPNLSKPIDIPGPQTENASASGPLLRLLTASGGALVAYLAAAGAILLGWPLVENWLEVLTTFQRLGAVAVLALLVAVDIVPRMVDWRRRNRLRSITGQPSPGYFRLVPRIEADRHNFSRADGVHVSVLRWIENTQEKILCLTGKSGCGKSSLLQAYVIPTLTENERWKVLSVRGHQHPIEALERALLASDQLWDCAPTGALEAAELLALAARGLKNCQLLIVFDQFEEYLVSGAAQDGGKWQTFLNAFLAGSGQKVYILLSIQTEYLDTPGKMGLPTLRDGENWFTVPLFTESAARDFLKAGIEVKDEVLHDVLREASSLEEPKGFVRPIVVNLSGMVLSRFATGMRAPFKRGALIRGFLKESIGLPELAGLGPTVLSKLISDRGTRLPANSLKKLAIQSGIDEGVLRGCLTRLSQNDRGIVRAVDADRNAWELSHDFLAQQLDKLLLSWKETLPRRSRRLAPWVTTALTFLTLGLAYNWRPNPLEELAKLGWVHSKEMQVDVIEWRTFGGLVTFEESARWIGTFTNLVIRGTGRNSIDPIASAQKLQTLRLMPSDDVLARPEVDKWEAEHGLQLSHPFGALRRLSQLVNLDLMSYPLNNLAGIEHLTNLERLTVTLDGSPELEALASLARLDTLQIISKDRLNVNPRRPIDSVQFLDAYSDGITDVSFADAFPNLVRLNVSSRRLIDLSKLSALSRLRSLHLDNLQASEIAFPPMPSLEVVIIDHSPNLRAINGLTGAPKLKSVDIYDMKISPENIVVNEGVHVTDPGWVPVSRKTH